MRRTAKPTYEDLESTVRGLEARIQGMQEDMTRLESTNKELLSINQDLETAIERANKMAMSAEIANSELNHIFNTAADGMCVIDKDFRILNINHAFSQLFGIPKENALHKKCFEIIPGDDCHRSRCPLARIIKGESRIEYDVEKKSASGLFISCILSASAFHDPGGELFGMVLNFKDITYRKQMEKKLRDLAMHDELTKLYNRRHFLELANREFDKLTRYGAIFSMLLMDVDNFKAVNDSYGHDIGDKALISLAQIGKSSLRKTDAFGRIGGEEFSVLLPYTDLKAAILAGERLRQAVAGSCVPTDKGPLHFTISIGVAQATDDLKNMEDLLRAADKALYTAKENGRNRVEIFGRG